MAHIQNVLILLVLCTLAMSLAQVSQGGPHTSQGGSSGSQSRPHSSQGEPHENQGRSRRQVQEWENNEDESDTVWTTCDFTVTPKISCHDCHTKLICKQIGGILKGCNSPFRPYCNNGICSATPSAECA